MKGYFLHETSKDISRISQQLISFINFQRRPDLTDGDLTMIFTVGGASQAEWRPPIGPDCPDTVL